MNNTPLEDRKLLYRDLCARMPYGVMLQLMNAPTFGDAEPIFLPKKISSYKLDIMQLWSEGSNISRLYKPCLFPLSSMTEEQRKEFLLYSDYSVRVEGCGKLAEEYHYELVVYKNQLRPNYKDIDWLNAHHFDYRGLIEKDLAIDATGKNIYS